MQLSESISLTPPRQSAHSTLEVQPSLHQDTQSSVATQDAALVLIPICFVAVWAAVVCVISNTWKTNRKEVETSKYAAQLPCKKCRFFNSNPYVKCAVNPCTAMTKAANDCTDYQARDRKLENE